MALGLFAAAASGSGVVPVSGLKAMFRKNNVATKSQGEKMPSGITIKNASSVQHFYTAFDKNNGDNVVFSGNLDPGTSSGSFSLAAGPDGTGSTNVQPAGLVGQLFFGVMDNQELTMN
jgi:hypothetical protein